MSSKNFYDLDPSKVFDAIESLPFLATNENTHLKNGLKVTGRYFQLNSYENRVFDVELESGLEFLNSEMTYGASLTSATKSVIAKFYRPQRWTKESINQEHKFLFDLNKAGIKAVSPYVFNNQTVFDHNGILFTLFPKAYGRMPQELTPLQLESIGRTLARLHNVGEQSEASNRLFFDTEVFGDESLDYLSEYIYPEVRDSYFEIANLILDELYAVLPSMNYLRIHGDCHKGNILQTDPIEGEKEYFFVDFDDFCNGPVVQDLWMLLSDSKNLNLDTNLELQSLIRGYQELREFNVQELKYIPLFQGLRIIYYAGWIAKRWHDPSFKQLFPQYLEYNYWAEELQALKEIWFNYKA
jgi:Ser/Thr protein kinase RdoA (MazF antagonist)